MGPVLEEEKPAAVEEEPVALTTEVGNCDKIPYAFCCEVGTKCDCSLDSDADGQCTAEKELPFGFKLTSYKFCCETGTTCDCSEPPVLEEEKPAAVEEEPVALTTEVGNCDKIPYAFCCEVGTKCDCSLDSDADGQCTGEKELPFGFKLTSYKFCCETGTTCDCSEPPVMGETLV